MVLETPFVAGITTEVVLSTLPGFCISLYCCQYKRATTVKDAFTKFNRCVVEIKMMVEDGRGLRKGARSRWG